MIDKWFTSYADGVLDGSIVAGKHIIQACKRFYNYLERDDIEFKQDKADRVLKFIHNITHGNNKQLNVEIQEWQKFILINMFGFYWKGTSNRVIHNVYIEVARKNGKSTLISLIALYMMMGDGEYRSEVDIVANSHKQAQILYEMSYNYCESIDPKGKYFKRYRDNIQFTKSKSCIQVLASDTKSLDGYNSYMFVQDEVHEAPNDLLYNVMKTSQASRENPMGILITTAGLNMDSFCYHYRQNAIDVLYGLKTDDSLFTAIYSIDEGDDYRDEKVWIKANPNLNISVRKDYLKEQVLSAENNISLQSNILTKNFNIWSQTFDVWIDDSYLIKSSDDIKLEDYIGKQVYVGVDLAAVSDLTAVSLLTVEDEKYKFWSKYYVPSVALQSNYNQVKYKDWRNSGFLCSVNGNITDYGVIVDDFMKWREMGILIQGVYYDSWNSIQWAVDMTNQGFNLIPFSQTIGHFNRATKEIERLIKSDKVRIANNPITRYCFQNASLRIDFNGNCKPQKSGSENDKIDGCISMVQALGGYLETPQWNNLI